MQYLRPTLKMFGVLAALILAMIPVVGQAGVFIFVLHHEHTTLKSYYGWELGGIVFILLAMISLSQYTLFC